MMGLGVAGALVAVGVLVLLAEHGTLDARKKTFYNREIGTARC
jgi:hypothetical protein